MKKNLILGSLCFLLLTGCSNDTIDNQNVTQNASDEATIIELRSESQRNANLEALIIETYEISFSCFTLIIFQYLFFSKQKKY